MDNVLIEILNENDIEEYSKLINEVMEEFNKEEITNFQIWFASINGIIERRGYNRQFNDEFCTVQFSAKLNDKIIGALEIAHVHQIQSFFVKKEFQDKGIGKKLFNYSIKYFNNKGFTNIEYSVFSSNYAIEIYKALGFKGNSGYLFFNNSNINET